MGDGPHRIEVADQNEDDLFRIFDDSQGLQRRVFRILARGFYNEPAIGELRRQAESILHHIKLLEPNVPR